MNRIAVDQRMALLADPATQMDEAEKIMAELDEHDAEALPWVYQWLHDAVDEPEVHAGARVLGRWVYRPVAEALRPALRAMIREPSVSDLSKLAAAALLEKLGEPIDEDLLRASMGDPRETAAHALGAALRAGETPAASARLVETVAEMPVERRIALIDDLVRLRDRRAAVVLGPMCLERDSDVAVAAVAAIELMGLDECSAFLDLAAEHHPDDTVRDQATRTLQRLAERPSGGSSAPGARLRLHGGRADRSPTRVLLVARERVEDGATPPAWDALTLISGDRDGVREYAVAEALGEDELDELIEHFVDGGVDVRTLSTDEARRLLYEATARTLDAGGPTRLGFLVWPYWVGLPEATAV